MDTEGVAGVAGLPEASNINGCDGYEPKNRPAESAGNPDECRTFPEIQSGYTYFVQRADGLIKIGFSARPQSRVKALSRQFGGLEILAIVSSDFAGEFETHQRFDALRVDGEWFQPEQPLLEFIDQVALQFSQAPEPRETERIRVDPEFVELRPALRLRRTPAPPRPPRAARTEFDEIVAALIRKRPHLPPMLQRRVSNIAEQVQNLRFYVRPAWAADDRQTLPGAIRRDIAAFERALSATTH
jgi:hypothetical protein